MFPVPGWTVPTSLLKTQVQLIPNQTDPHVKFPKDAGYEQCTKERPRKRKRNPEKLNGVTVTGGNLAELWEKHIEGKNRHSDNGERQRKLSKGKDFAENGKSSFPKHKTLKEKKREKKALFQASGGKPPPRPNGLPEELPFARSTLRDSTNTVINNQDAKLHLDPEAPIILQSPLPSSSPIKTSTLTPLQKSMRDKLTSARFRHLNQTLYTKPSSHTLNLFRQNPNFFTEYHEGFRRQVCVWPQNPIDRFIKDIRARGEVKGPASQKGRRREQKKKNEMRKDKNGAVVDGKSTAIGGVAAVEELRSLEPLPRSASGLCTIADLGCGDASFAASLAASLKPFHLKIHSYDLCSVSELVMQADIKDLPLKDGSLDVAIFCLALMGTNWIEFVEEAWRTLRWRGELWVAEIRSRFGRMDKKKKKTNQAVAHSVGSKAQGSQAKAKTNRKRKLEDAKEEEEQEQEIAAVEVDGVGDGPQSPETDVAAFVEVLQRRGFVLKGDVDADNKMFVRMRFTKSLTPTRGKCVPKMNDQGGETWGRKVKSKFLDVDDGDEGDDVDEARTLKPCVYKTR